MHAGPIRKQDADPLVDAITVYRDTIADFNANAPAEDAGANAYAQATYKAPLAILSEWRDAALTATGALAALCLARDANNDGEYAIVGSMIEAVIAYFETTA